MTDLRLVYITATHRDEALTIGRALVKDRLAACVNILEGMTSISWWDGQPQEEQESILIVKTRADRMKALTEAVKQIHSYEIPCIISLPISGQEGNQDFLSWIRAEASPHND